MQDAQNMRQQIVERIRQSTSILVAVGNNPSVDALAAALGLSLMLNKMNKHTTAVFSGYIPPAIQFLEPNKTFESNVDALRDFIISLDKEKADRLRYKVEDDVVRIYITPYKTSITEKDLQYSQGDFNVDLIVALGVEKRDDLDKALVSHGRILHDATIVTLNANSQRSSLGAMDWNDPTASSLCEMLTGMSEAFQQPGLLDAQISTALLTGIVAATERFSNTQTSPRVMTLAAQLMAAGANQQLIAINLAKPAKPSVETGGAIAKQQANQTPAPMQEEKAAAKDGELDITHPKNAERSKKQRPAPAPSVSTQAAEDELAAALPAVAATTTAVDDLKSQLEAAQQPETATASEPVAPGSQSVNAQPSTPGNPEDDEAYITSHGSWKAKRLEPPTLGGTLSATSEEALKDEQAAEQEDRNKTILTHPGEASAATAANEESAPVVESGVPVPADESIGLAVPTVVPPATEPEPVTSVMPTSPTNESVPDALPPMPTMITTPDPSTQPATDAPQPVVTPVIDDTATPDLAAIHQEIANAVQPAAAVAGDVDSARAAVSDALSAPNPAATEPVPAMPANVPVSEPLTPAALQALPPAPVPQNAPAAAPMSVSDLPPMPPTPPMPTSSTDLPPAPSLPGLNEPLPPITDTTTTPTITPPTAPVPSAPDDPGQFKIPGA